MDNFQNNQNNEEKSEEKKDFVFIREEIKSRPLNGGKLAKSTMVSAISAVVFGLVACLTFAILLPYVSGLLKKDDIPVEEEKPNVVIFPVETEEEEMNPEDMLQTTEPEVIVVEPHIEEKEIQDIVENMDLGITVDDFQNLYSQLAEIADDVSKSIVRVRTVVTDTDWFDNLLEESEESTGLIVADNGTYYFIVTYTNDIDTNQDIYVTFQNDVSVKATLHNIDLRTGLCILSIPNDAVNKATQEIMQIANLGSSNSTRILSTLVLAVGSPMGSYGSMNYGMITSYRTKIKIPDNSYKRITTNIYGSHEGRGVITNIRGEVLGIIAPSLSDKTDNLVCAIGISELKKTIENMINDKELTYLGIHGSDVPEDARTNYDAPKGAFITGVEMDSPAMIGGIQAGDIIVEINRKSITSYLELVSNIRDMVPEEESTVVVGRQSQEGYKFLSFTVVPTTLEDKKEE